MRIPIEIPASALTAYVPDSLITECPKDAPPPIRRKTGNSPQAGGLLFGGVGHGSLRDTWRSRRRDLCFSVEYAIRFLKQESVWRANN
jgi:hypothetical protein